MSEANFFQRIGNWFKKPNGDELLPLDENHHSLATAEQRSTFLRPWAKRDVAISNLQDGFHTLTDLMGTIRDNLEQQNHRQDELLGYLSHLPEVLQTIPESNRMHGETLKAIHQQMESHGQQQQQLADILEKMSDSGDQQQKLLKEIHQSAQDAGKQGDKLDDTLHQVGTAMHNVSQTTQASTHVLEELRENIQRRDDEMKTLVRRQASRYTVLMGVAIVLSLVAVAAVVFMGYLLLSRPHG